MKFSILGISYLYKLNTDYLKVYLNEDENLFEDNEVYKVYEHKIEPHIDIIFHRKKELIRVILIELTKEERISLNRCDINKEDERILKKEILDKYLKRFI